MKQYNNRVKILADLIVRDNQHKASVLLHHIIIMIKKAKQITSLIYSYFCQWLFIKQKSVNYCSPNGTISHNLNRLHCSIKLFGTVNLRGNPRIFHRWEMETFMIQFFWDSVNVFPSILVSTNNYSVGSFLFVNNIPYWEIFITVGLTQQSVCSHLITFVKRFHKYINVEKLYFIWLFASFQGRVLESNVHVLIQILWSKHK